MADIYPEHKDGVGLRIGGDPAGPDSQEAIEVLILSTKFSTVNKSLIHNLRFVDPDAKRIKITCAVLEEEGKIPNADLKDADERGIHLKGARQPRGCRKKPNTKWLNESVMKYYGHVPPETNFDFIISHIPYLTSGCLNIMDWYHERTHHPKVILIIHGLPRTSEGQVDEVLLLDWLTEADVVFSSGMTVKSEIIPCFRSLEPEKQPIYQL